MLPAAAGHRSQGIDHTYARSARAAVADHSAHHPVVVFSSAATMEVKNIAVAVWISKRTVRP